MPHANGLAAPGKRSFVVMPVGGGTARELTTHQDYQSRSGQIAWSPDGQHVYFVDATGADRELELWRIPAGRGKRQLVGFSITGNMAALSVHSDGRRNAFHGPYLKPGTWVLENFLPSSEPALDGNLAGAVLVTSVAHQSIGGIGRSSEKMRLTRWWSTTPNRR